MANAAFLIGMTLGLKDEIDSLLPALPFRYAEYNFYRAAQTSLDAELLWPDLAGLSPRTVKASELCLEMLPVARDGLDILGVDAGERDTLLDIVRERLENGTTPARWLRRRFRKLEHADRSSALAQLVEEYLEKVSTGQPVSTW